MTDTNEDNEQIREKLQEIREGLGHALLYSPDDDVEDILKAQAAALDAAFRILLAEAPQRYSPPAYYAAALKAQNQFRHTALALKDLKNRESDAEKK